MHLHRQRHVGVQSCRTNRWDASSLAFSYTPYPTYSLHIGVDQHRRIYFCASIASSPDVPMRKFYLEPSSIHRSMDTHLTTPVTPQLNFTPDCRDHVSSSEGSSGHSRHVSSASDKVTLIHDKPERVRPSPLVYDHNGGWTLSWASLASSCCLLVSRPGLLIG